MILTYVKIYALNEKETVYASQDSPLEENPQLLDRTFGLKLEIRGHASFDELLGFSKACTAVSAQVLLLHTIFTEIYHTESPMSWENGFWSIETFDQTELNLLDGFLLLLKKLVNLFPEELKLTIVEE